MVELHSLAWQHDHSHSRPVIELQHSVPSQVAEISPSVELVMGFISKFRKLNGSQAGIEMTLGEALANAVVHGNHEDPDMLVHVVCRCDIDGQISIMVREQGRGFDCSSLPGPTAPENHISTHGRGIYLKQALMDEVSFDGGGVVVHTCRKPIPD